jgi:ribosomal protein S18 acetylase RimI-like enzyme
MSTLSHSILPVTDADLGIIGDLVHSCKLELTINRLLFYNWPNDDAQKPQYAAAVQRGFNNPSAECYKAVDDESGEILGYVIFTRNRPTGTEQSKEEEQDVPRGVKPEVLSAVNNAAAEIWNDTPNTDHFSMKERSWAPIVGSGGFANWAIELVYLCVRVSNRRRGIASQLVRQCSDKAKAEGVPIVVMAEPAAYEFYSQLGFRETKHVDIDLRQWAPPNTGFGNFRLYGMIWSPED